MYIQIDEPAEKISHNAVKVWRISNTLGHVAALLIVAVLLLCAQKFGWYDWIEMILYIIAGLLGISAIISIFIEPVFLQRTWRYRIDEEFVQLKKGKWEESHTLVPMEKVEYVRTEQGPILRRYGLYNIVIGTTTSQHVIPAIPKNDAQALKLQIATFAKVKDEDTVKGEKGT